jgi:hypothetical protein
MPTIGVIIAAEIAESNDDPADKLGESFTTFSK